MIKDLQVQAISYKTRGIKAGDRWIEVPYSINLDRFTKGKVYTLEVAETFDDKFKLVQIVERNI
jgi:hypothetical protein